MSKGYERGRAFRTRRGHLRRGCGLGTAALLLGTLAACGSSEPSSNAAPSSTSTGSPAAQDSLTRLLPESLRNGGTLRMAVTATYPPYEFLDKDGSTLVGANVEVVNEVAARLGLKVEWSNVQAYGSLIPGLQSNRYDGAIIFEDTLEREKAIDLVDFYQAGLAILGPKGDTSNSSIACGKRVAVGTGNLADLRSASLNKKLCEDKGLPKMEIKNFANTDGQFTALTSGRVDFILLGDAVGVYFASSNPKYGLRSEVFDPAPNGIGVGKDKKQLSEALAAGLQTLIDDGTMKKIFESWDLGHQLIDKAAINITGS